MSNYSSPSNDNSFASSKAQPGNKQILAKNHGDILSRHYPILFRYNVPFVWWFFSLKINISAVEVFCIYPSDWLTINLDVVQKQNVWRIYWSSMRLPLLMTISSCLLILTPLDSNQSDRESSNKSALMWVSV